MSFYTWPKSLGFSQRGAPGLHLANGQVWQVLLPGGFLKSRPGRHLSVLTGTAHPPLQSQSKPVSSEVKKYREGVGGGHVNAS